MGNKANILRQMGRLDESEELYLELIPKKQICIGEDHPGVCLGWQGLTGIYVEKKNLEMAMLLYNKNVNGLVKWHGEEHQRTVVVEEDMQKCQEKIDELTEATAKNLNWAALDPQLGLEGEGVWT
jgi:hypothetical protein